jgi:hypothetical protein
MRYSARKTNSARGRTATSRETRSRCHRNTATAFLTGILVNVDVLPNYRPPGRSFCCPDRVVLVDRYVPR